MLTANIRLMIFSMPIPQGKGSLLVNNGAFGSHGNVHHFYTCRVVAEGISSET